VPWATCSIGFIRRFDNSCLPDGYPI